MRPPCLPGACKTPQGAIHHNQGFAPRTHVQKANLPGISRFLFWSVCTDPWLKVRKADTPDILRYLLDDLLIRPPSDSCPDCGRNVRIRRLAITGRLGQTYGHGEPMSDTMVGLSVF
jgi:hypothetical protein